ncbi:hypothetical protein SK3146_03121 [Paenibacillus konkukensis]|uniref:SEC-C motif-containing protein n=1 Tax=Paenibacillus konkukensis TaxID=2020716 RepID=A0ABY4RQE1_9BACL|nr:SEC-C metal-binding domain-containing protein [Paenibacillus konkukensis]UQZ83914.1 hypothetical protein SK3146_03121 [Paenibacillus konkukensis]
MDKHLSAKDQKMLLNALGKLKETQEIAEAKEEEKRWSPIEVPLRLADHLATLTKADLTAIRVNLDIKGASSLKKQDLCDKLSEQIPALLPNPLAAWDETRHQVMQYLAANDGRAYLPLGTKQLQYFKERGLIFTGTWNGEKTLVMPQEVLEAYRALELSSYREASRRNTEWIKLTQGLLFYYGTLDLGSLEKLLEEHTGELPRLKEYLDVIFDSISFYEEIKQGAEGFSNIRVFDPAKVKEEHALRSEVPFRPFTKDELIAAGEPNFVDANPSYQAFVELIDRCYSMSREEAAHLIDECVYAIRIGQTPNQLFNFLQHQLEIKDLEMVKAIMDHIVRLHNHTRQWALKGYYPTELSAQQRVPAASGPAGKADVISFATRKKVGRNDPCPCGSGKKYKKCCGS